MVACACLPDDMGGDAALRPTSTIQLMRSLHADRPSIQLLIGHAPLQHLTTRLQLLPRRALRLQPSSIYRQSCYSSTTPTHSSYMRGIDFEGTTLIPPDSEGNSSVAYSHSLHPSQAVVTAAVFAQQQNKASYQESSARPQEKYPSKYLQY
jgi:hypothetical protein